MKRPLITTLAGLFLGLFFAALLTLFQLRESELGVVTTFGRFSRSLSEPGLYVRWPWPVQRVYRFDKRIQNFERKFEQTTTADGRSLIISAFLGYRISNPRLFLERFAGGDLTSAELNLEGLLRDTKNGVIGRHAFADLISTNRSRVRLRDIEQEMLTLIQPKAEANYGITIELLGIKQLGLPESITTKVFERMKAERQRLVKQYQSEGEAEGIRIQAEADRTRQEILAQAEAQALVIRGQGEAEAAKSYVIFEQNPELAVFLIQLNALFTSLKDRSTLVLDPETPPFNLLKGQLPDRPASTVNSHNLPPSRP